MKKLLIVCSLSLTLLSLSGCEGFKRNMKSVSSDWNGGLNRTVNVYNMEGKVIKTYTGKFDVKEDSNKVMFDLNGKRIQIYNATVIVEEN
ncbi:MAG TPA: DUF5052 family protein [Pseudoneobacillus sp.]|nr:DUF5052 family protein [Pseudoneobacillus sp.]